MVKPPFKLLWNVATFAASLSPHELCVCLVGGPKFHHHDNHSPLSRRTSSSPFYPLSIRTPQAGTRSTRQHSSQSKNECRHNGEHHHVNNYCCKDNEVLEIPSSSPKPKHRGIRCHFHPSSSARKQAVGSVDHRKFTECRRTKLAVVRCGKRCKAQSLMW